MKYNDINKIREKTDENDEKTIIDLYLKGASRNQIATVLRKNKNDIQVYINWLNEDSEYRQDRELAIRNNRIASKQKPKVERDYDKFLELYKEGASEDYIRSKLRVGMRKIQEYKESLGEDDIEKHYENIDNFTKNNIKLERKEILTEYNVKPISSFFGHDASNVKGIYCRVNFTDSFIFKKYHSGQIEHETNIITKKIVSKGDMADLLDIIEEHKENIDFSLNPPYCKDFDTNTIYSIEELARKKNVRL